MHNKEPGRLDLTGYSIYGLNAVGAILRFTEGEQIISASTEEVFLRSPKISDDI